MLFAWVLWFHMIGKYSAGRQNHGHCLECQRHCWKCVAIRVVELCGADGLFEGCISCCIHWLQCFNVCFDHLRIIYYDWTCFITSAGGGNQIMLTAVNPDAFSSSWSSNSQLRSIGLLYRRQFTSAWTSAINADGSSVAFPYQVSSVCGSCETMEFYQFSLNILQMIIITTLYF